jgi:hypothetical protein
LPCIQVWPCRSAADASESPDFWLFLWYRWL